MKELYIQNLSYDMYNDFSIIFLTEIMLYINTYILITLFNYEVVPLYIILIKN